MKKTFTLLLLICLCKITPLHSAVFIAEVYGGGGNTGATYQNDYVFLYNNGADPVDLSTWSLQYASATGTSWAVLNLVGTVAAGGFFKLKLAAGNSCSGSPCGAPLPFTPDQTSTFPNLGGAAGKLALCNNQVMLTGACPTGGAIQDFVGYGSTANCFEGAGPAPAPGNTTAIKKTTDTNNNNLDYTTFSLPILLTEFQAVEGDQGVEIRFSTASERNNDYIAIERSSDGIHFQEIGRMKGAGTSFVTTHYAYTDRQPLPGKNYYRLRQVDFDGEKSYSGIVAVHFGANQLFRLYPTVAADRLQVVSENSYEEDLPWEISDLTGRVIVRGELSAETGGTYIETSGLLKGAYFFRLFMPQGPVSKPFLKG